MNKENLECDEVRELLKIISEAPYVGICIFDDKQFFYANGVLEELIGYSFKELQNMSAPSLIDLGNYEKARYNLQRRLEGERFTTTYSGAGLKRKDGREIVVKLCIQTIRYRGKYAALASVVDITDIVEQEKRSKRLSQALEQTDDLLLITDLAGKMIFVNRTLIEKTGYSQAELIGKNTNIFKSGKHSKNFYKRLWDTLLEAKKYKNVLINRTKEGKLIYLDTIITPVLNESGTIESFVSTAKDITNELKTKKRLKKLATIDTLTKVANRYELDKKINYHLQLANRYNTSFAILMFDIDFFKNVNDTYGHYIGDVVLKKTVKLLLKNIREIDEIGRWGGEEFIIILSALGYEDALKKAEELRIIVENNLIEGKYKITTSVGVSLYQKNDTKDSIVSRADNALYKAKKRGRNCVVFE